MTSLRAATSAAGVSPDSPSPAPAVRADIIQAATRVFSQRGYHAASMTEIAAAVGMRKPSLYHHVRKKEDLLFAIHEQLIDELTEETTVALASADPQERLRQVLRVSMSFVARHRDGVTVFLQERRAVSGQRWSELVVKRDRYERMVSDVIAEGRAAGAFVDVPPEIAARALLGMANWGYTWFDPQGKLSAETVADVFADIVLDGLLKR